jgi:magnesium transporter
MILAHPEGNLADAVWIDLCEPTDEELARVSAATGLRIPNQNEISEIESSSRLAFEKGAYHVSTPLVALRAEGEHVLTSVGFVLSSRVLLTVRFMPLPTFDAAHQAFGAKKGGTAEDAFLRILEIVVDRSADKLEHAGAECDEVSRSTFRDAGRTEVSTNLRATLARVGRVADAMSRIRDSLLGLGRLAAYVMESGMEGAPQVNAARMKAIRADVASLTDYEAHLSAKSQFLLDATLGFINIEQNEIVKILTIASVVGIPPVLVAGIYGMNFHVMPELGWSFGYPMAIAVIALSALLPLAWFKRRKWMG